MKSLGVIQIIDSLSVGGAEVLAVNIANALSNRQINSHICVTRNEGDLKNQINETVGYLFLNRRYIVDIKSIITLRNYIKTHKIDIIHAHSTSSFIAFCVKLLFPKVKIIWHDHYGNSDFLNQRSVFPLNFLSLFFSAIIVVNGKLKEWSRNKLFTKSIYFLNNFASFNNESEITKLKGITGKRIVLLAGFRTQKDHLNLLRAFKEIIKKHPDWSLHFIGKVYDDAYSKSIKRYISIEQLSNKVFIYGVCSDIKYILSQVSISVLSSKSEGLPISLLEYGLAKLPVVVTDVGDCSSVVEHGITGLLVEKLKYKKLEMEILNLIEDVGLREKLGNQLFKKVNANYSKKYFLNDVLKIYNQI